MHHVAGLAFSDNRASLLTHSWFAIIAAVVVLGVYLVPPMVFIIDGAVYLDMVRAMADHSVLYIGDNGGVDGAPALTKYLTVAHNGLVYPQYPSGYAFLATPFYNLFGLRGLIMMNALATLAALALTHHIAKKLFDERCAVFSVAILGAATFIANYTFAIWPHMLMLVFWLGALSVALSADRAPHEMTGRWLFYLSGLIIGFGVNIRIDMILAAPAILLWLRLFARPDDRRSGLIFMAGLAPGLLAAAYLNFMKFGVMAPFSYGVDGGAANTNSYIPTMLVLAASFAGAFTFNMPRAILAAIKTAGKKTAIRAGLVLGIILMLSVGETLWRLLYNVYVLTINLQGHNAYYQAGVEPNEFGQLMFWGFPKRALIQSLPFLPLLVLPIFDFLRGKNLSAISLCLLAIAAPISFYALKQWHGGGSYNMRYFIPALPFIAILCAVSLIRLIDAAGNNIARQHALMLIVVAAVGFIAMTFIGEISPALYAPAALYPQWVIAGALMASLVLFIRMPQSKNISRITLNIAIMALAYAGAVNFMDEVSHEKARAEQLAFARNIDRAITENGALVVSQLPVLLMHAQARGANILVATEDNIDQMRLAINAFSAAGRCVYLHNSRVLNIMAPVSPTNAFLRTPYWAKSDHRPKDPRLAFFGLASQAGNCAGGQLRLLTGRARQFTLHLARILIVL